MTDYNKEIAALIGMTARESMKRTMRCWSPKKPDATKRVRRKRNSKKND